MRKLVSQLFKKVASDTCKKKLLPTTGPLPLLFLNGFKWYVPPIIKLEFVFGLGSGDSQGLRAYIDRHLPALAHHNPNIEFQVTPRNGTMAHVRGTYITGPVKLFDAYNKSPEEIERGLRGLIERSGERASKFSCGVRSVMPAIRPLWSPFHANRANTLARFVSGVRSHQQRQQALLAKARTQQHAALEEFRQQQSRNAAQ